MNDLNAPGIYCRYETADCTSEGEQCDGCGLEVPPKGKVLRLDGTEVVPAFAKQLGQVVPVSVKIRGPIAGMTPTDEQAKGLEIAERLFAARQDGFQVLVLKAGAGTGKTAELRMVEQVLPGQGQGTAFNSSLVADNAKRFVKASWKTTHALAFRAVGCRFAHRLNGPRVRSEQVARALGIEAMSVDVCGEKPKMLQAGFLAGQVSVAVKKFCQTADREITTKHFRYIDGIDQVDQDGHRSYANNNIVKDHLLPFAQAMWTDLSKTDGTLPFNHDVYVKLWQLGFEGKKPYIACDYLMLDEYQDTAEVFIDILKQQIHALLILVGDDNQRIYEWRGAVNAADHFSQAEVSWLSQSFRFGQSIADVANSVLRTLQVPTDLVMKGLKTIPSRVAPVANPHCVLCRTNAGAVSTVLRSIAEGKSPHLIGGGADVVAWVRGARDLQDGKGTSHPELCCFSTWTELEEYAKSDEGEDLALMVKLVNEFTAAAILGALENMPDEKDADLVVGTCHRSKGREWRTVRLAGDFPTADRLDDAGLRLLYVGCTRAQEVLDLSQCPAFIGGESRSQGGETRQIPGIEIKYTCPMPTVEELEIYQERQAIDAVNKEEIKVLAANPRAYDHQKKGVIDNTGPAPKAKEAEFTWANIKDGWRVRGPEGMEGKTVTVTKRDGSSRQVRLGKVVHQVGELYFYAV